MLETQIRVWEARRREDQILAIGTLDPGTAARAVMETFAPLAHACAETGALANADAATLVEGLLLKRYISSLGQAAEAAQQVLWTWGEAGVFVVDDQSVRPRLRLFGETGEALHALSRPSELRTWVEARLRDEDRQPEMLLACELSDTVVELVVEGAEKTDRSDPLLLADLLGLAEEAISTASRARAATNPEQACDQFRRRLAALIKTALGEMAPARIAADEPRSQRATRGHQWVTWHLAGIALRVADVKELPSEVAPLVDAALAPPLALLWRAAMWAAVVPADTVARDVETNDEPPSPFSVPPGALSAWTELLEAGLPPVPSDPRLSGFDLLFHGGGDRGSGVLVRAAAAVLPFRPDLAPSLVDAAQQLGRRDSDALEAILAEEGHSSLLEPRRRERELEMGQLSRLFDRDDSRVRAWLAGLAKEASEFELTDGQRWRLPEIGALVALYDLPGLLAGEQEAVLAQAQEAHRALDEVAVTMLGLDPIALGAEARHLADSWPADGHSPAVSLTLWRSSAPAVSDWRRSDDPETDRETLINITRSGHRMLVYAVCTLLEGHPDPRGTAALLCEVLPELRAEAQYIAAVTTCALGGSAVTQRLALDDAPLVRAGAGIVSSSTGTAGFGALRPFAEDPDRSVRALVLNHAAIPNTEERELIRLWATTPPVRATCIHCGTTTEGTPGSCQHCELGLPSLPDWFSGEESRAPVRRVRRRRTYRPQLGSSPDRL